MRCLAQPPTMRPSVWRGVPASGPGLGDRVEVVVERAGSDASDRVVDVERGLPPCRRADVGAQLVRLGTEDDRAAGRISVNGGSLDGCLRIAQPHDPAGRHEFEQCPARNPVRTTLHQRTPTDTGGHQRTTAKSPRCCTTSPGSVRRVWSRFSSGIRQSCLMSAVDGRWLSCSRQAGNQHLRVDRTLA